jgi:GTPase SAR1 family protein
MKVAFIGTHGVGKTTLCYDLASRLKRQDRVVDIVQEVARACPLPINRDTTLQAQAWILHTQIAQELAASARVDIVICDRSVLDNYAYLVHQAGHRPEYDALVREWVMTYDFLFKVPIIDAPTFDGTRDVSRTFQRDIDGVIDRLAAEFAVDCVPLDPGHREGWVDTILTACGLPLRPPQIDLFRPRAEEVAGAPS